jgi:ATP-dependent helicase HrpB
MNQNNSRLPVEDVVPELIVALAGSCCAVLSAPPGAGKTTRVPLALLHCPWLEGKKILMLEPRRLAARRAAGYMARQLGEREGQTVGYRIRGDAVVSRSTRVEVVTEGILTRMLHTDPDLSDVGLIIFDEFHERSIHADLGLAFALDVQTHLRNDLRILVMSATLDGIAVADLLGGAPIIESAGRMYPVETKYARFVSDKPVEHRVADTISRALGAHEGDVLVFLPGMREIRRAEEKLQQEANEDVVVHTLHGDLSIAVQDAALAPASPGKRKVILSTSIAETSLTIDGVCIVVDSGLARAARFDPRRGMSELVTTPVSRAVADQRRGRAGRQSAGVCYRLWTENDHAQLPEYPTPEIRVSDLAHPAMDLALWGAPAGEGLRFLDPPPPAHLAQAQEILKSLGAMTEEKHLTAHGRTMAGLPLHPRFGHMIIKGKQYGWGATACELAALLEERDLIAGGKKGDVASRVEAFRRERGATTGVRDRVAAQKRRFMEITETGDEKTVEEAYGPLLALAYPDRVARKRPGRAGSYQLSNGTLASLPPGSLLAREEFLAVANIDVGGAEGKIYLAAPVNQGELEKIFADAIVDEREVGWDGSDRKVKAQRTRKLGAVVLAHQSIEPNAEEIKHALIEGIRSVGLQCLPWDKEAERFRSRVLWVRRVKPDLPDLSDTALESSVAEWLAPFLGGVWKLEQLQKLRLGEILRSMFSPHQLHELERLAPPLVQVPSGSRIILEYAATDHPALSVKLQELFGLTETPRIAGGTVPVTIHLLSPAGRPLAVTQDLRSFWENVYPEIIKQLRARYPKHPWPEDPLSATPTRKTIRKRR